MPELEDKVLAIMINGEVFVLPKGNFPEVGDRIGTFKLGNELVTTGKSNPELNDHVISVDKKQSRTKDGIVVIGKGEIEICPIIGDATPRVGEFTLSKLVKVPRDQYETYRHIVNSREITRLNIWFNIWGNLTIKVDGEIKKEIMGANGEAYQIGGTNGVAFSVPEEGALVELIFTGSGLNGMSANVKGVESHLVYACYTEM